MRPRPLVKGLVIFLLAGLLPQQSIADKTATHPTHRPKPSRQHVLKSYGKLPMGFEANRGQTDPQVKFLARGRGYTLFLTPAEVVMVLRKVEPERKARSRVSPVNPGHINQPEQIDQIESTLLRIQLVGANRSPAITGLRELPGKSNYFIGKDSRKWTTNIPLYSKVKYQDVYPGIDLVFYGNPRQLEYDFVVAPGVDPKAIRLRFHGADHLVLDDQGNLIVQIPGGEIIQHAPVLYQENRGVKQAISGRYVLVGDRQVSFRVGTYDVSRPLIIDPVLSYSTYLGGSDLEQGNSIAVDADGNAYVTGPTFSADFPKENARQTVLLGDSDAFVTKLNPAGNGLVYSTYLGGSARESGVGIAVDGAGHAYVTGPTSSLNFPTQSPLQGGCNPPDPLLCSDAFVAKLNPAGNGLVYSTYLGGSSRDQGFGIAVDAATNAYVTGATSSDDFPGTVGSPIQAARAGRRDAFVSKVNAAGSGLGYSTYLGGSDSDFGNGIAVDATGNAYVTGQTFSADFRVENAFQPAFGGPGSFFGGDAFVAKVNPTGSALVYSSYLGSSSNDAGAGIAADTDGNAYVTGLAGSDDFPKVGAFLSVFGGVRDVFVTKVNPTGFLAYSLFFGGSRFDIGNSIAVDDSGNAFVAGSTQSPNFPTTGDALQAAFGGGSSDAIVAQVNPTGSALVDASFFGGSGGDFGAGIAVDAAGNAYVTGATNSINFRTANPFQPTFAGGDADVFVAKIAPTTIPIEFLDPVPDLLDELTQTQEQAKVKLSQKTETVDGVAADDVARVVVRVTAPEAGTVQLALVNGTGNAEEVGFLTQLGATTGSDTLFVPTDEVSGKSMAFAIYRAPSRFVRAAQDANEPDREVSLRVSFIPQSTGGPTPTSTTQIKIARPPVVLVHGLWSSQDAWNSFDPLITDPKFFAEPVDYRDTHGFGFNVNAPFVGSQLEELIGDYKDARQVAAVQADVVAHSMGGLLVRRLPVIGGDFFRPENFQQGDVHKLITIANPNFGSELARFLLEHRCVAAFFNNNDLRTDQGAIRDLVPNSTELSGINTATSPLRLHFGVGRASDTQKQNTESSFGFGNLRAECSADILEPPGSFFDSIHRTLEHDLIVSAPSQQGGSLGGNATSFPDVIHTRVDFFFIGLGELESEAISRGVIQLLNSPLESSLFEPFRPVGP